MILRDETNLVVATAACFEMHPQQLFPALRNTFIIKKHSNITRRWALLTWLISPSQEGAVGGIIVVLVRSSEGHVAR